MVTLVPPGVVTCTSTVPAVSAGAVAVQEVAVHEMLVALFPAPKVTAVALARLVPVTVTSVPPDDGPAVGLIDVTTGAATYVY